MLLTMQAAMNKNFFIDEMFEFLMFTGYCFVSDQQTSGGGEATTEKGSGKENE